MVLNEKIVKNNKNIMVMQNFARWIWINFANAIKIIIKQNID